VAATNRDVGAVGLLRPGYTDPQGNTSDGERGLTMGAIGTPRTPIFQGKIDTLSPVEQIKGMSDQANVTMIVGSQDKVAPPVSASAIKPWPHSSAKKSGWCNWRARC